MKQTKTSPDFIVTLPPPTPNGSLHVGHMAGPFLAADIFTKAAQALDQKVHVLSFSDTNQSYVRATAENQNRDPAELASTWTKDICETLDAYSCQVDYYFEPHTQSNNFVLEKIIELYTQGVLKIKPYPFLYSIDDEQFLDEAGASGLCPRCLDDCKCGICEACGFPNQADTLINPRSTNNPSARVEVRYQDVLILEVESWRNSLREFHNFSDAIRPKYRWLVDDALTSPLPDFPITVPGSWGIKVDHPDLPGQVINAWPEIAFNFVYAYQKAIPDISKTPKIVNFFGYDNSYFYAFVHVALLQAANLDQFLPHATIINEFYNFENAKFSTSRGHLIWAKDIAQTYPADLIRFYSALSSPGFEQGNFKVQDMQDVIENRLIKPYQRIAIAARKAIDDTDNFAFTEQMATTLIYRVATSLDENRFNLRQAAEDILKGLSAIEDSLSVSEMDRTSLMELLKAWAHSCAPIMPTLSKNLLNKLETNHIPDSLACLPSNIEQSSDGE